MPPVPWTPAYQGMPPLPPYGTDAAPGPGRRRPSWGYALLALGLLAALGVGVAVGAEMPHGASGPASPIVIGAATAPNVPTSTNIATLQQAVEQVARAVQPSVVEITSVGGRQEGIGSGDILTKDGYIVTNDHVVQGFDTFTVTLANGTKEPARVVGQDPADDLAVIKIAASNLQPIAIADSSKAQVGEFAIALGTPLGLRNSVTFGVVSALNRSASEAPDGPADTLTGLIQTSAPINPGNSGGALVNLQGQLIGIPTLGETDPQTGGAANSIGYAIASNQVSSISRQLIQHGSVSGGNGQTTGSGQGFIGIEAQDLDPTQAAAAGVSGGVLVAGYADDTAGVSPGQQAGLQVGDVIVAVDGQVVGGQSDLTADLASHAPGSKVTLTVVRNGSQVSVTVTRGTRPANAGG
jgi:putative serine protease PepD